MPPSVSTDLYKAALEPKDLWLIPGGDHAMAAHDPVVNERSLAWLARWLTP